MILPEYYNIVNDICPICMFFLGVTTCTNTRHRGAASVCYGSIRAASN